MAGNSSHKRRKEIYIGCRMIFANENALLRTKKKIRKLLELHTQQIAPLTSKYGLEQIVTDIQALVLQNIFESHLKARSMFPELDETATPRQEQRSNPENEAAQSEIEAFAEVEPINHDTLDEGVFISDNITPCASSFPTPSSQDLMVHQTTETLEKADQASLPKNPHSALFPVYFDFRTQHKILARTQALMEEACFNFGKNWLPHVLQKKGWDCPEAGELNLWTRLIAKHLDKLPADAINKTDQEVDKMLIFDNDHLRHAAVHRHNVTVAKIQEIIQSAQKFAKMLNHSTCAAKLEQLHIELRRTGENIQRNKEILENRRDSEIRNINEQRKLLDIRERDVLAEVVESDKRYQQQTSSLLEQSLAEIFESLSVKSEEVFDEEDEDDEDWKSVAEASV